MPRGSEAASPLIQDVHGTVPAILDNHGVNQIPHHRTEPGIAPGFPDQLRLVLARARIVLFHRAVISFGMAVNVILQPYLYEKISDKTCISRGMSNMMYLRPEWFLHFTALTDTISLKG